jgi:hypothetical protein
MGAVSTQNRQQKEAFALLQTGTFCGHFNPIPDNL